MKYYNGNWDEGVVPHRGAIPLNRAFDRDIIRLETTTEEERAQLFTISNVDREALAATGGEVPLDCDALDRAIAAVELAKAELNALKRLKLENGGHTWRRGTNSTNGED